MGPPKCDPAKQTEKEWSEKQESQERATSQKPREKRAPKAAERARMRTEEGPLREQGQLPVSHPGHTYSELLETLVLPSVYMLTSCFS